MTCRDIIISGCKRLGADELYNKELNCACDMENMCWKFGYNLYNCTPAKLVNGEWVAVEGDDTCGWSYVYDEINKDYQAYTDCGALFHGRLDVLKNNNYCPECGKPIREVKS